MLGKERIEANEGLGGDFRPVGKVKGRERKIANYRGFGWTSYYFLNVDQEKKRNGREGRTLRTQKIPRQVSSRKKKDGCGGSKRGEVGRLKLQASSKKKGQGEKKLVLPILSKRSSEL